MAWLSRQARKNSSVGQPTIEKIRGEVIGTIVGEATGKPDLVNHDSLNRYRWRLEADKYRKLKSCAQRALAASGVEAARKECMEMSEVLALEEADLLRTGIARDLNLDELPVSPDRDTDRPLSEGRWLEEIDAGLNPQTAGSMASLGAHAIGRGVTIAYKQGLEDARFALADLGETAA